VRDPWREGKYVDLWSLVHVHGGFLVAWLLFGLGLSLLPTAALTLLALALYEIVEYLADVEEHATNRITDLGFGIVGIALAHAARAAAGYAIPAVAAVSFALLNLWGWWAWMRREGKL